MTRKLSTIAAFDILPDRSGREIAEDWPEAAPGPGATWRWLHCDRTSASFVAWSAEHLPPPVRAGLLEAETRPGCEAIAEGILVTLRAMNRNPGTEAEDMVALRLWIGPSLVVSTRHRRLFSLTALQNEIEKGNAPAAAGTFVARLIDSLTDPIEAAVMDREDQTDEIEEALLDRPQDGLASGEIGIARLARAVIKLRRHIAPQRDALQRLAGMEGAFLRADDRHAIRAAANSTARAVEGLDTIRDRIASLRAHVDSLSAARLGRNSFLLSVIAAVFLPLGFLTGLFGMNLAGMPGTSWPWAFAVAAGGLFALGLGLWLMFRWLKWF